MIYRLCHQSILAGVIVIIIIIIMVVKNAYIFGWKHRRILNLKIYSRMVQVCLNKQDMPEAANVNSLQKIWADEVLITSAWKVGSQFFI